MRVLIDKLVEFTLGLVLLLLTARFILKLLGANAAAPFVEWIYETTLPLLAPFIAAFPTPTARGGFVLEFTTLFAILVYAFIGFLIQELIATLVTKRDAK